MHAPRPRRKCRRLKPAWRWSARFLLDAGFVFIIFHLCFLPVTPVICFVPDFIMKLECIVNRAVANLKKILRINRRDESPATAGHPARDGDCEKIRAGIPAAARRVNATYFSEVSIIFTLLALHHSSLSNLVRRNSTCHLEWIIAPYLFCESTSSLTEAKLGLFSS